MEHEDVLNHATAPRAAIKHTSIGRSPAHSLTLTAATDTALAQATAANNALRNAPPLLINVARLGRAVLPCPG